MGPKFYLKKAEASTGLSLIYLQWKYKGRKLVYAFGETIDPKLWNDKTCRVREKKQTNVDLGDGRVLLNDLLDALVKECHTAYNKELVNGTPQPAQIKQHLVAFMNKNKKKEDELKTKPSVWDLIDRFVSGEIKDTKTKKQKAPGTLRTYNTTKSRLEGFEKSKDYKITLDNINHTFLDKYIDYLRSDCGLMQK